MAQHIRIHVVRDPETGARQDYLIEHWEGMTVLEALNHVWTELDSSLGYSFACRIGTCGACLVELNGRTVLACQTAVGAGAVIGPARGRRVLRDVATAPLEDHSSPEQEVAE